MTVRFGVPAAMVIVTGMVVGTAPVYARDGAAQYRPHSAHVPACAHAGRAIALPRAFPHNFPVPAGTVFDGTRVPIGGGIAVKGFIPSKSFASSVHFFPREVKRAGFSVFLVEIDTPHDSEGHYRGHGYTGGWSLKALPGCAGAMAIQVEAVRSK